MKNLAKIGLAALLVFGLPMYGADAQTDQNPPPKKSSSNDAGAQFDAAGKRLGEGAEHIGEGFKQGAIQAWEAVKAGAHAAGDKLSGKPSAPSKKPAHTESTAGDGSQ